MISFLVGCGNLTAVTLPSKYPGSASPDSSKRFNGLIGQGFIAKPVTTFNGIPSVPYAYEGVTIHGTNGANGLRPCLSGTASGTLPRRGRR